MKTRKELHEALIDYLQKNLPDMLGDSFVKKIKIVTKGNVENRFSLRTGVEEAHLDNWWRHPIFILATQKDDSIQIKFQLTYNRSTDDKESYAEAHQAGLENAAKEVSALTKKHFDIVKEAEASTKLDDKYMATITTTIKINNQELDDKTLTKVGEYISKLAEINLKFSQSLDKDSQAAQETPKKKKLIRLSFDCHKGGFFKGGVIDDSDGWLRNIIYNGQLGFRMYEEDEGYYDDPLYITDYSFNMFSISGPDMGKPGTIRVEESVNYDSDSDPMEYAKTGEFRMLAEEKITDTDIKIYIASNPQVDDFKYLIDGATPDSLMVFVEDEHLDYVEQIAIIELDEEEKFDFNNVYLGTFNLDEILGSQEILREVLYLPANNPNVKQVSSMSNWGSDPDTDEIRDMLGELEYSYPSLKDRLYYKYRALFLYPPDVETSGTEYVQVRDLNNNILGLINI